MKKQSIRSFHGTPFLPVNISTPTRKVSPEKEKSRVREISKDDSPATQHISRDKSPIQQDLLREESDDKLVVEIPGDLCERFENIWREEVGDDKEMQVYLIGRRRMEAEVEVLTVFEMILPAQTSTKRRCVLDDTTFLRYAKSKEIIGMMHVHCDGTGCYLSGPDQHTAIRFNMTFCPGKEFFSAVFDSVNRRVAFMKIKTEKKTFFLIY